MFPPPIHIPSPALQLHRTYPVLLTGTKRTASVSIGLEYPPSDFIAPDRKTTDSLMEKVWAAIGKMTGWGERVEIQEGAYIVWLRVKGMSIDSSVIASEPRLTVQVVMEFLTGPRPPRQKPPTPKPWTPERIAAVLEKAHHKAANHDLDLWHLVSSRFRVLHTTSFRTLGEAVEFGYHSFERGDSYALCVVRNGAMYYWYSPVLDDAGRDAHIERAIQAAAECGIPVSKVIRRIGQ